MRLPMESIRLMLENYSAMVPLQVRARVVLLLSQHPNADCAQLVLFNEHLNGTVCKSVAPYKE